MSNKPVYAQGILESLYAFYQVATMPELVYAMDQHIEALQGMVREKSPRREWRDRVPREG